MSDSTFDAYFIMMFSRRGEQFLALDRIGHKRGGNWYYRLPSSKFSLARVDELRPARECYFSVENGTYVMDLGELDEGVRLSFVEFGEAVPIKEAFAHARTFQEPATNFSNNSGLLMFLVEQDNECFARCGLPPFMTE